MAVAIALARALYPLDGCPDAVLESWYSAWVVRLTDASAWGAALSDARAHLLGHCGEMWLRKTSGGTSTTGGGGAEGVVTSSKSSTLSMTVGAWAGAGAWTPSTPGDAALVQTEGGRAYLALRSAQIDIGLPVVG
jgi:hypothetical protein